MVDQQEARSVARAVRRAAAAVRQGASTAVPVRPMPQAVVPVIWRLEIRVPARRAVREEMVMVALAAAAEAREP